MSKYYGNNPASIIYDLLVNVLGYPSSSINMNSFIAASNYYYNKSWGLNITITSPVDVWEQIRTILGYVDSILYLDGDGKFCIKVLEYGTGVYDGEIIDDFLDFKISKRFLSDVPNLFKANYVDRDGTIRTISIENPAMSNYTGLINCKTYDLTYFNDRTVAYKRLLELSARDGFPYATLSIKVPAKYSVYNVGDVLRIVYSEHNIDSMFRIVSIDEGDIENNVVSMTLIQDSTEFVSDISDVDINLDNPIGSYIDTEVVYSNDWKVLELYEKDLGFVVLYPKLKGNEAGFVVYMSYDNVNFSYVKTCYTFSYLYDLQADIPYPKYDIDDENEVLIKPVNFTPELLTKTRSELFSANEYLLVDNEIMKYQVVDLKGNNVIGLQKLVRGYNFTDKAEHLVGAGKKVHLFSLGDNIFYLDKPVDKIYLKVVPFNSWDAVDISEVSSKVVNINLNYRKPIDIQRIEIKVNTDNTAVIETFPRIKNDRGCGIVSADTTSDGQPADYLGDVQVLLNVNGSDVGVIDTLYNTTISGYPTTFKFKIKKGIYYSDEVSITVSENNKTYIYNDGVVINE